jgi:hypothetical protein
MLASPNESGCRAIPGSSGIPGGMLTVSGMRTEVTESIDLS